MQDGTLIKNKSGRTYAKNEHDWCWWNPIVPKRIETLSSEGLGLLVVYLQYLTIQPVMRLLSSPIKTDSIRKKRSKFLKKRFHTSWMNLPHLSLSWRPRRKTNTENQ